MTKMQLLAAVIATTANAQGLFGDYGDLDAFGLGTGDFGELGGFGAAGDSQKYFFTPVVDDDTPPVVDDDDTPVVTGTSCWKCDAMKYSDCATLGHLELCPLGDLDCCFVEIRETQHKLQQLCTGCKDYRACKDNQHENFYGTDAKLTGQTHQCRPDYRQERIGQRGPQQSICRQCFATCNAGDDVGGSNKCFGSMVEKASPTEENIPAGQFMLTLATVNPKTHTVDGEEVPLYPWGGHYSGSNLENVLGIPTFGALDGTTDADVITKIVDFDTTENESTLNIWFHNEADGKVDASTANGNRDRATDMTYWALQGADQAWWSSNLKDIQVALDAKVEAGTAITAADFNPEI